ncbi:MAG TPA: hypothetical protein PK611_07175 [Saprospiraceae bacterium]|nr:hypothetical protein [Saprospiraceae bacterium]HRO73435.1 hypothetical protein [Saprospiraceae bacterium]
MNVTQVSVFCGSIDADFIFSVRNCLRRFLYPVLIMSKHAKPYRQNDGISTPRYIYSKKLHPDPNLPT